MPQVEGGYLAGLSSEQNWGRHTTWGLPRCYKSQKGSVKRSAGVIMHSTVNSLTKARVL